MSDPTPVSKLAAILAADVVGFSLKMGENEYLTLKNLKACRAIVDSAIKNNQGRIFTTAGDSVIAEFASPVNALVAAVEFQKNIMARNSTCAVEDRMEFRVGLNLGDVIVEGDNLYGDGVNVAARIEASAEAGGINVSAKFYDEVKRKLDLSFESLGEQHLKNIADSVSTYRVSLSSIAESAVKVPALSPSVNAKSSGNPVNKLFGAIPFGKGIGAAVVVVLMGIGGYWGMQQGNKPSVNPLSIAVLPFTNLTGDPAQSYVADGITAKVTTDLSRIRDTVVMDVGIAMKYKDKAGGVQLIASELGVRFVLQGDVQKNADKVQINAKLTDALSNKQLWSESFEGEMSNLFALQDKVTNRISGSLGPQMLIVAGTESEKRKSSSQASELILRGRALTLKGNDAATFEQRIDLYRQALKLEPNNLDAMSGLSLSLGLFAPRAPEQDLRKSRSNESQSLALKVKEIDPNNREIYMSLALYDRENNNLLGARQNMETWLELNPNARNISTYGNILLINGEATKAIEIVSKIHRIHSKFPSDTNLSALGRLHLVLGQTDLAIDYFLKATQVNSKVPVYWACLAVAQTMKGESNQAAASVAEVKKLNPNADSASLNFIFKPLSASPPSYKEWYEKTYLPAYRKAGLKE
jgi:TolB-like protein/class 3 adenylate cyclase/tetratricopeptide (TPR) repeat protein